jgi:hypothetical protein
MPLDGRIDGGRKKTSLVKFAQDAFPQKGEAVPLALAD